MASTQPEKPEIAVTSGGKKRVPQAATVFAEAFDDDPAIRYMLCNMNEEEKTAYMHQYMKVLMTAAGLNKAVFDEAGDWSSCAVWMPPGTKVDNVWTMPRCGMFGVLWTLGIAGVKRMIVEFTPQAAKAKKEALGKRPYWYLFFIGTLKASRGKGLSTAVIKNFQQRAAKEQLPIWLEATTENSKRLYLRCGFKELGTIVLGKGIVDALGYKQEGGPGVCIWTMLWDPEQKEATK